MLISKMYDKCVGSVDNTYLGYGTFDTFAAQTHVR